MAPQLLSYVRRHVPSDERTVNRLFVSAFIRSNSLVVVRSQFLSGYIINDGDEDFGLLQDVSERIKAEYGEKIILETLVKLFEFVISPADRVVTGAIYTPVRIRETILKRCIGDKSVDELGRLRISDIACGCGGFLMDAAHFIHFKTGKSYAEIFQENIFGIDVQEYSIERTKILLSLLALKDGEDADFCFNLLCSDTLDFSSDNWDETYNGFDVIVGNPPYVCSRNLPEDTRSKMKGYEVCGSGHPDLYIPFFQIAIEMLNATGRLGYITMNTFLRSINGRSLRKYFRRKNCELTVLDFRGYQVFESRNTYTCLFYYDKAGQDAVIHYAVDEQGSLANGVCFTSVSYNVLDDDKGWALNDLDITFAIESTGVKIKDYCPSRHGIATLSNDTYIFQPTREDDRYYYLEKNGTQFPIEKEICRRVFNPNRLTVDGKIEASYELIIYPYLVVSGTVSVIPPEIMWQDYPCTLRYLESRRDVLLLRDKGDTSSYPQWYAFGRTQSLVLPRYKLFFPKFSNKPIRCFIVDDPDLMLYNGLAFVNSDIRRLEILKRVIESKLFWRYVAANAKPYASGYYSLSGVDIKHFGIPVFSLTEENELLSLSNKNEIEHWLINKYGLAEF
ncbi:MAG: N-6 DNA methylase [Bacteroidales bacterium]|nr:N-6 DNA methylase [Bacteroidales bacterium]